MTIRCGIISLVVGGVVSPTQVTGLGNMFSNTEYTSSLIGSFLVSNQAQILTTWCKENGVNEVPRKNRNFNLMVVDKLQVTSKTLLSDGAADICKYSFKIVDGKLIETTSNTEIGDLNKEPIEKAISKEVFVSGSACGLTVKEIQIDKSFQKDLILNQKSISQHTLDIHCIMQLPRQEMDLSKRPTGWYYSPLSTNVMNNSPSQSGLLLNTSKAFKLTVTNKTYNSSLFAQSIAIDTSELEQQTA